MKKLTTTKTNPNTNLVSIFDFFKKNTAGRVNSEMQIKLNEYVPIIEMI